MTYSYAKVLLTPGQRLGYLAVSPRMPWKERQAVRNHMSAAQVALGWCFPNAVMQYAIPDLEGLSIDMRSLSEKRNRMIEALEKARYEVLRPEGTFYLFGKCPGGDPNQFWNALADHDVFVIPGSTTDVPGYFRICLTASTDMVEHSLPIFAEVAELMRCKHEPQPEGWRKEVPRWSRIRTHEFEHWKSIHPLPHAMPGVAAPLVGD